jgi:hypothetical protein
MISSMSRNILSYESPKEHYRADALIFWCFDDRLWKLRKLFIKKRGFKNVDCVQAAGGAKALSEGDSAARQFLLDQVATSIRLHDTKILIPTLHIDCGGFGGSKAFHHDSVAERAHHEERLKQASVLLKEHFPHVTVEQYIADFDGLDEVQ